MAPSFVLVVLDPGGCPLHPHARSARVYRAVGDDPGLLLHADHMDDFTIRNLVEFDTGMYFNDFANPNQKGRAYHARSSRHDKTKNGYDQNYMIDADWARFVDTVYSIVYIVIIVPSKNMPFVGPLSL